MKTYTDTLVSIPQSKFSDSISPPSTPVQSQSNLITNPENDPNLVSIPYHKQDEIVFAWANQLDPHGPGPNSATKFTPPSPEFYPISIWTPPPIESTGAEKHWWEKSRQIRNLTWDQACDIITGKHPVVLCGGRASYVECKKCRRENEKFFIGGEASIGGNWGTGVISEIIGNEESHVVVLIEGPHVHTKSNCAKARIATKSFHFGRIDKCKRLYLRMCGKLPDAPSVPMASAEEDKAPLPGERGPYKHLYPPNPFASPSYA
ncbi:hypothetical protein QCA50_020071 [Cerrena zonata]|uniref:Uncharacterized protein n=1 Tax=Cerrena zonata TaxID=2478898 RepID=A0AAW0FH88_9APHY